MKPATRPTAPFAGLSFALIGMLACAAPAFAQAPAEAPAPTEAPAATAPAAAPAVTTTAPAAGPVSADTVVATVNGEAITSGQMIAMKSGLNDQQTGGLPPAALAKGAELTGGLRLLSRGRLFRDGEDVYPDLLDAWAAKGGPCHGLLKAQLARQPRNPVLPLLELPP